MDSIETIENAKIKFTQTGVDIYGSPYMQIGFELSNNRTVSTGLFSFNTTEKMKSILNVLELRNWEDLPKKYARVAILRDQVVRIGNILNDKWVEI